MNLVGLLSFPGKTVIPAFSDASTVSSTLLTLDFLLSQGSPSPTSTKTADWRTYLTHCLSKSKMPALVLSQMTLIFPSSPFNSELKAMKPITFSLFKAGVPQQAWCCVNPLMIKTNPWSKPPKFCWWHQAQSQVWICTIFFALTLSFPVTGRIEDKTPCALDLSVSHPQNVEVPLDSPQTSCWTSLPIWKKTNNR